MRKAREKGELALSGGNRLWPRKKNLEKWDYWKKKRRNGAEDVDLKCKTKKKMQKSKIKNQNDNVKCKIISFLFEF
jgi:hypothetical protein